MNKKSKHIFSLLLLLLITGILSICASKLGAGECKAYDIDPVAVKVAKENAENGTKKAGISSCALHTCLFSVVPYGTIVFRIL